MSISRFHFSLLLCLAGQLVFPGLNARAATATVAAGQAVTLTATATGTQPFAYQWFKDGGALTGATAPAYEITGFKSTDAGAYTARIANTAGTVLTAPATLVSGTAPGVAPVFTTPPVGKTVVAGSAVTFTVVASGTPAPTYQWRKDGVAISGATAAAYTIANATAAHAGTYTVMATNATGSATSSGAVLTVQAAPTSSWQSADIGAVGMAGANNESNGVVTLGGAGADIWGTVDAFRFRSQALTGDGAITVRVAAAGNTHAWAKVGVMFREDLSAGSREVMAFVTPGNHSSLQYRLAPGAQTTQAADTYSAVPAWLMLVRSGNTFGGYKSANGVDWTPLGSVNCVMPATLYVGLAVSSHDAAQTNTATFDNVVIDSLALPSGTPPVAPANLSASGATSASVNLSWSDASADETGFVIERALGSAGTFAVVGTTAANTSSYVDAGLASNTSYNYRVRAQRGTAYSTYSNTALITTTTVPPATPSWIQTALGAGSGSFAGAGTTMSITATGADIWGQFDDGLFVNRAWTGNGEITVRVDSLTNTHAWAKAGVTFRESLAATAPNIFLGLTPGAGATLQVREASSGVTSEVQHSWAAGVPSWLRLTRTGNTFTAAFSANGTTWTLLGTQTLVLPATVYVGFGVSSHAAPSTTAAFSNVQVR